MAQNFYRLLYVDNYNQRPKIDLLVLASNKPEAEAKGYAAITKMAMEDLRYLTNGSRPVAKDVIRLSSDYFSYLVHGCWTLVECEKQVAVSKHESKRSAEDVAAAAEKSRRANRKKRRWSKAEKAARKAAKLEKQQGSVLTLPAARETVAA